MRRILSFRFGVGRAGSCLESARGAERRRCAWRCNFSSTETERRKHVNEGGGSKNKGSPAKDERRIASSDNSEFKDIVLSGVLTFSGVGLLSALHLYGTEGVHLLQASLGATAVLIFGAPQAPASQPRAVIMGHSLAGVIGVSIAGLVSVDAMPLAAAAPLAVSSTLMAMRATKSMHPPAGGTCLIAAIGSGPVCDLGYLFICPAVAGSCVLVGTAWLAGLASSDPARQYPQRWI